MSSGSTAARSTFVFPPLPPQFPLDSHGREIPPDVPAAGVYSLQAPNPVKVRYAKAAVYSITYGPLLFSGLREKLLPPPGSPVLDAAGRSLLPYYAAESVGGQPRTLQSIAAIPAESQTPAISSDDWDATVPLLAAFIVVKAIISRLRTESDAMKLGGDFHSRPQLEPGALPVRPESSAFPAGN